MPRQTIGPAKPQVIPHLTPPASSGMTTYRHDRFLIAHCPAVRYVTDTGLVISCRPTRSWLWHSRVVIGIAVGGGITMLIAAAAAHDASSVPLLAIGGWWLLGGLLAIWQSRRYVNEIVLDGDLVEFRSAAKLLTIPAIDIIEVSSSRRAAYLRFRTRSSGVIRIVPRLQGLFDLLTELRRLNPELKIVSL